MYKNKNILKTLTILLTTFVSFYFHIGIFIYGNLL